MFVTKIILCYEITIVNSDNIIAPKKALQKFVIVIPGTRWATNINNNALITNTNSPNVNIFIGKKNKTNAGLIKVFTRAITIADNIAVEKLETTIPGTIQAVSITANDKTNH